MRFKKGHIPWHKGLHGDPRVIEIVRKAANATRGKKRSVEFRKKVSVNNAHYWLGKKFSQEAIEKRRLTNTGRKLSEEHKRKIGLALTGKKRLIYMPESFYKRISILGIQKQQNSKEPTSIEKIVYDFLKSKEIIFEKQKLINGKFLVDVYIPELNLVIECDGIYWHSLDRVVKKDKAENAYLKKCGFNLLRLREDQIKKNDFLNLEELICVH